MRLIRTVAMLVGIATGSGALEVRKSPADYPLQGESKDSQLGVEYTVRTFIADPDSFSINDYLLLEIGVFPKGEANVNLQRFTLRVNGKNVLLPQTPGMVAASLKYPDWTRKPRLEAGLGSADGGGIILGRPQRVPRFPGDPTTPQPRSGPTQTDRENKEVDYAAILNRAALPEGPTKRPVAGYVFFAYNGKLKSIRSVELLVDGNPLKLR